MPRLPTAIPILSWGCDGFGLEAWPWNLLDFVKGSPRGGLVVSFSGFFSGIHLAKAIEELPGSDALRVSCKQSDMSSPPSIQSNACCTSLTEAI